MSEIEISNKRRILHDINHMEISSGIEYINEQENDIRVKIKEDYSISKEDVMEICHHPKFDGIINNKGTIFLFRGK